MSKKNVVKSLLAVVMVGFVLSFSSCKEEKKIIGKWKLEKVEVTDFICSNPLSTIMLKPAVQPIIQQMLGGSGVEYEFAKDGKVTFNHAMTGKTVAPYEVNDKKLSIAYDYITLTYGLSFDKKTMYWNLDLDGNTLETISMLIEELAGMEVEIIKCVAKITLTKQ